MEAGPGPILGLSDQAGAEGVTLDVAEASQKVAILLDGKRPETPLPNMPRGLMAAMMAADMSGEEPLHEAAKVTIGEGPQHEVEVVGHEAVRQNTHREAVASQGEQIDEDRIVLVIQEDGGPSIPAIEDMVAMAGSRGAKGAWHESTVATGRAGVKNGE